MRRHRVPRPSRCSSFGHLHGAGRGSGGPPRPGRQPEDPSIAASPHLSRPTYLHPFADNTAVSSTSLPYDRTFFTIDGMRVGIPTEVKNNEFRVAITPS